MPDGYAWATSADAERLSALDVRTICDVRRADERELKPTRWRAQAVTVLTWEDGENVPTATGRQALRQFDAEGMRTAMLFAAPGVSAGDSMQDCFSAGCTPADRARIRRIFRLPARQHTGAPVSARFRNRRIRLMRSAVTIISSHVFMLLAESRRGH